MNLLKDFDCLTHDLVIAKFSTYSFDTSSVKLMHNYLTDKINNSCSVVDLIKNNVQEGFIFSPMFFNIFLCDLFLIV